MTRSRIRENDIFFKFASYCLVRNVTDLSARPRPRASIKGRDTHVIGSLYPRRAGLLPKIPAREYRTSPLTQGVAVVLRPSMHTCFDH
jgi:hypothetical protein